MENLMIILFYIFFALGASRNFKLALYSVFLFLPTYRVQFNIFGLPFNLLSGVIWILVLVFFIKNIKYLSNLFRNFKKKLKSKNNIFNSFRWPIILIIISAYSATFWASDLLRADGLFKSYFLEAIFFFILLVFNLKKNDFQYCVYSLQILAFLIFGVALYQKLSGNFIFNTSNILEQGRVTTFFGYPNANGLILLPVFFLSLINLFKDKKIFLIIFNFLTLIFSLIVIYWARSESALVAIIMGLLLLIAFKIIKNKKFILTISLSILFVSLLLPFVVKAPLKIDEPGTVHYTIIQKLFLQDLSGQIRRQMWHETTRYLKDYPLTGAGLSAYQEKIKPYHQTKYIEIFLYPHQIWLNFWVSLGIFGLLGFLWLSVLLIFNLTKKLSPENLILLITFLVIIIQGAVEVPYFKNDLAIIWWLVLAGYFTFNLPNYNNLISNS